MTASINKHAVASSFSRAAAQYDQVAYLQMQVGQQLLDACRPAQSLPAVLDIGCGTGRLTRKLAPLSECLVAMDFAPGMLQFARQHHADAIRHFVCADADAMPFAASSFDLVFSNFVLQWCESFPALMQQLMTVLRPGGQLLFSLPGERTLWELKQSWQLADPSHVHVNKFMALESVTTALENAGFYIETAQQEDVVVRYDNVRDLTRELKTLGAHNVNTGRSPHLTGKRTLTALIDAYEHHRVDGMIPATWNIIRISARKP